MQSLGIGKQVPVTSRSHMTSHLVDDVSGLGFDVVRGHGGRQKEVGDVGQLVQTVVG